MLFYDLQHCQKSTKKATCDLYLVDVVVALSVGEGFEVFKVFVGQVDADVVGVIVSRKEGGRRHCGVRQRRRISLSYPVLVPPEERAVAVRKSRSVEARRPVQRISLRSGLRSGSHDGHG